MANKAFYLLTITLVLCASGILGYTDWPNWGGNLDNTHSSTETGISPSNVGGLQVKWTKTVNGLISAIPTTHNGVAYFPDHGGSLWAVNIQTGATVWTIKISDYNGNDTYSNLGSTYSRASPAIYNNKLYFGDATSGKFYCVDMLTGAFIWRTELDTHVAAQITQSATVFDDKVFVGVSSYEEFFAGAPNYKCCSFRGSMNALNAYTGELLWKTYMCPENYSGNAVWGSSPAIDPATRTVYIATGNNYEVPDELQACLDTGALNCTQDPANLPDAFVALNLDTGAILWNTSILNSDVFNGACFAVENCPGPDADFAQAPMIINTPSGKRFIGAGEKNGFFTALNVDGSLAWVTNMGGGGVFGGSQWGSAYDGTRIYVAIANANHINHTLPDGTVTFGGFWLALNPEDGTVLWETPVPEGVGLSQSQAAALSVEALGPVTAVNGVIFVGVYSPGSAKVNMYALDGSTGRILWSFVPGASIAGAPTFADGVLLWGSGYSVYSLGNANESRTFYAFALPTDVCVPSASPTPVCVPSASPSPILCPGGSSNQGSSGTGKKSKTSINFYFADMLAN